MALVMILVKIVLDLDVNPHFSPRGEKCGLACCPYLMHGLRQRLGVTGMDVVGAVLAWGLEPASKQLILGEVPSVLT